MTDSPDSTHDSLHLQEALIAALRTEVAEYGALLNLLTSQQEAVLDRKPGAVLQFSGEIEVQIKAMDRHRKTREAATDAIALVAGLPPKATLRIVIPHFRTALRPLIEALVDEVNRLIAQTRRGATQNQVLLARSVELGEEMISRLNPRGLSKTYSARGKVNIKLAAGMSRLLERS